MKIVIILILLCIMVSEDWLSVPTVILSFFSITSCFLVCIISLKEGYIEGCNKWQKRLRQNSTMLLEKTEQKQMMMEIIFWFCIGDGLWSIDLFLNWFRQLSFIDIGYWTETQCVILGNFHLYTTIYIAIIIYIPLNI